MFRPQSCTSWSTKVCCDEEQEWGVGVGGGGGGWGMETLINAKWRFAIFQNVPLSAYV